MQNNFYTPKELAVLLGFSTNTIYKYLEEGRIKASRLGKEGRFRISEAEIAKLLGQDTGQPQPASPQPVQPATSQTPLRKIGLLEKFGLPTTVPPHKSISLFTCFVAVIGILTSVVYLLFSFYKPFLLGPTLLLVEQVVRFLLIGAGTTVFVSEILAWHKVFKPAWVALAGLYIIAASLAWVSGDFPSAGWLMALPIAMILSRLLSQRSESQLLGLLLLIIFGLYAALIRLGIGWETGRWLNALLPQWLPQHEVFYISCGLVIGAGLWLLFSQTGFTTVKKIVLTIILSVVIFFSSATIQTLILEQATLLILLAVWIMILISPWLLTTLSTAIQTQFAKFFTMMAATVTVAALFSLTINWYGLQSLIRDRDLRLATTQNSISNFLEEARRSILLANQFDNLETLLENPNEPGNLAAIQQAERAVYLSSASFQTVVMLAADGQVIDSYPTLPEVREIDLSDREYFTRLVNGESLVMSDALVPEIPLQQPVIIVLSHAIRSDSGELLGVMIGLLNLERMIGETSQSAIFSSFDSYLMLADKSEIIFTDSRSGTDSLLLTQVSIANEGSLTEPKNYPESSGLLRQRIAVPHESSNWYVILDYPIERLFAESKRISYIGFIWIFFSGLLLDLALIRKGKLNPAVHSGGGKNL